MRNTMEYRFTAEVRWGLQGLDQMGANQGAGPMLVLAALREHGRLRDAAIEVSRPHPVYI